MKSLIKEHKLAFSILLLLLIGYIAGAILFSMKVYPNTTVNGEKRGMVSREEIFDHSNDTPVLKVLGQFDEELELNPQEIDYIYEIVGDPQVKQNVLIWPLEIFQAHDYQIDYEQKYDVKKLDFLILESDFDVNGTLPKDAYVEAGENEAVIVPEQPGTRIDPEKMKELILASLAENRTEVKTDTVYFQPEVRQEDESLKKEVVELNKLYKLKICFDFVDREYVLGGKELAGMVDLKEDGSREPNRDKLTEWVAEMAAETDTYGTTRTFEATGIGQVQVPPGIYGWQINVADTVDYIIEIMDTEEGEVTVEPKYNHYGYARQSNDIGDTYIEVDLSRQYLWAYSGGELIYESNIVSGMGNTEWSTPVGVNMIWSMERDQVLKGSSFDTGVRYESPVKYWMPINWWGVGLHDASWRSSFGGSIYMGNGSNGCINLPESTAAAIFNNFYPGTPVVVYESSTDYSPTEDY